MKLIRELRWGAPKAFKTGAIVGTYPKPMLYLGFDVDGLSVIPSSKQAVDAMLVKFNVTWEEIVFCKPGELKLWVNKPKAEQPKILCVDYTSVRPSTLSLEYNPSKDQVGLNLFQAPNTGDYNQIAGKPVLPWETVVFDGVTGYMELVLSHFSSMNPNRMADARDWAFQIGQMVKRVLCSCTMLPCHVVCLMHSETEKSDLTMQIDTIPSVYGKEMKQIVGGLFSQYFYAAKENGKPVIWTNNKEFVKGVGSRWPILPAVCAPDFNSIYGKELP